MNELEEIFISKRLVIKKTEVVPDRHYSVLVTLIRSDRPRFWKFLCVNCGSMVAELLNEEVVGMDDFFDPQSTNNHAIARHCKGYSRKTGLPCPYKYFFHMQ